MLKFVSRKPLLFAAALATSATLAQPCWAVPITLYDTGVDPVTGLTLEDNTFDPNYTVRRFVAGASSPVQPVATQARVPGVIPAPPWVEGALHGPADGDQNAGVTGGRWITTPDATDVGADEGTSVAGDGWNGSSYSQYEYIQTFTIGPNLLLDTAVINGTWAADNTVAVFLNGNLITSRGTTTPPPNSGTNAFGSLTSFSIPRGSGFQRGTNTLRFVVTNTATNTGLWISGIQGDILEAPEVNAKHAATPVMLALLLLMIAGSENSRRKNLALKS